MAVVTKIIVCEAFIRSFELKQQCGQWSLNSSCFLQQTANGTLILSTIELFH